MKIIVPQDGPVRFLYHEGLSAAMSDVATVQTFRASRCEPASELSLEERAQAVPVYDQSQLGQPGTWFYADMRPVAGPIFGPFPGRQAALDYEVRWLEDRQLPVPEAR